MTEAKSKRRWLQFSLRTLLVATAIIAAWLAFYYLPAKRADRAAKALQDAGFQVCYDYQHVTGMPPHSYIFSVQQPGSKLMRNLLGDGLFQHAESISLDHKQFPADDLSPLETIQTIRSVSFGWCRIGDEHVKHLAGLRRLELLQLEDGQISDRGLSNLARLTELQILSLENNQIHGDGLQYLTGLAKLSNLVLDWNPISDDGLINLESLANLEVLGLSHTKITDEGIKHLAKLKKLKSLNVGDTQVSRAGAMKLQVELPNCDIEPFMAQPQPSKPRSSPFD